MLLKKLSAAAAGLSLLAAVPAVASAPLAAASATTMLMQDDDDGETSRGFDSMIGVAVAVAFTAAFVYFLVDSQENDGLNPVSP